MLNEDWRWIVRKAWSFKLMALAGVLTALEALLPFFADDIPRGVFAGISLVVIPAALAARLIVQRRPE